jgi:hypothetical protein
MLVGSLAAGLLPAGPALATDPLVGSPIPEEPTALAFPREVIQAKTFDIDGDGVRELATIGISSEVPNQAALQIWWVDAEGRVTGSNEVGLTRFDGETFGPARISDGAALFEARRDGRPHLFVALEGLPQDGSDPCCLTILEVAHSSGQSITADRVADTRRMATQLAIADLDGDRTDELVAIEGPWSWEGDVAPPLETALLRWEGSRFDREAFDLGLPGCCVSLDAVGNTDGYPGEDLHVSVFEQETETQRLLRVTLRDQAPALEFAQRGPTWGTRVVQLETGPAVLTMNDASIAELWQWPRDQAMQLQARQGTSGCGVAAVLGSGPNVRFLASVCASGEIEVMPGNLVVDPANRVLFAPDWRVVSLPPTFQESVVPFEGRIPDGLPGIPEAYFFSAQILFPVADPERLAGSQPAAMMIGTRPVGRVGPDGAWEVMALNDDAGHYEPNPAREFVWIPGQPTPGPLRLVPAEALLRPDQAGGSLTPTFYGAARDPDSSSRLLAGVQALDAEVHGPPGSSVRWLVPGVPDGHGEISSTGVLSIPVLPSTDAADRRPHSGTVWITVVTPVGNAYSGQWSILVIDTSPDLVVTIPAELVEFEPVIAGRTSPGAEVTVNGIPANVGSTGAFRIRVEPGVWPTEFRIVATDPVDNTTVKVVSLVWPVDYRRLPFIPIVFFVTVAAGIVLFVRRPVTGEHRRIEDVESTIEEIGD